MFIHSIRVSTQYGKSYNMVPRVHKYYELLVVQYLCIIIYSYNQLTAGDSYEH